MRQGEDYAITRERQRRFARARTAARALCPGLSREDVRDRDLLLPGTTLQRYSELFVVMGLACGTPGGHAIASLARRGYVIVVTMPVPHQRGTPRVMAINTPGVVWFGAGLPTAGRPWDAVERHALQLEVAYYPVLQFASGHELLRIRQQLRREGHDVG